MVRVDWFCVIKMLVSIVVLFGLGLLFIGLVNEFVSIGKGLVDGNID